MDERRTYEVRLLPTAHRQLLRLPRRVRDRLASAIQLLSSNPRPVGYKKLSAQADYYRIRVGDYRVLYEVRDLEVLVIVIKIGHRRDVYR
ncbi:MAG TPA: type II toxin-antitoxin system RelE/ParE family toxin [Candidatus Dormibacteraeota bacterium]|nr:type II toxin-antitoxin system RelE/ParE family toxin [Candidatus Dormibacteraeota bacterium]